MSAAELDELTQGTTDLITQDELVRRLEEAKRARRALRVKLGADPSAPDLHLGHTLVLSKLKDFQRWGHTVIFLVGDFTARIGDPSGRSETRKPLTSEEIRRNASTYTEQVFRLLDRERTEVRFNSEWMDRMVADDLVRLCGHYTVARILERDDFSKRFREGRPIGVHEFLYPLIQGYDSVALRADVEVGGSDQRFNLLVGREVQKAYGGAPQIVMTLPLLEGTDGVQKMSKSLGNAIGISEPSDEIFGKIMSVSDELMLRWYDLLEPAEAARTRGELTRGSLHPRDAKAQLAERQVARFHGAAEAREARTRFDQRFARRELPAEMVPVSEIAEVAPDELVLPALLTELGLSKSNGDARRLIREGAVRIDGRVHTSERYRTETHPREADGTLSLVIEVGKRRARRLRFTALGSTGRREG